MLSWKYHSSLLVSTPKNTGALLGILRTATALEAAVEERHFRAALFAEVVYASLNAPLSRNLQGSASELQRLPLETISKTSKMESLTKRIHHNGFSRTPRLKLDSH
jgi:hypothetical protein